VRTRPQRRNVTDPPTLNYADPKPRPRGSPKLGVALGIAGCVVGALATLIPLWPLAKFYQIPAGTVMRPMGMTGILGLSAAAGLLVALPLTLACLGFGWRTRSTRRLALLGLLLSASAICLGFALFNCIVAARGFVLEE
jgi:hypothetical protein